MQSTVSKVVGGTLKGMGVVLKTEGLCKNFGGLEALQNLSLEIEVAQSVALIGANGAGKSTLIKCLLGLLRPSSGQFQWFDCRPGMVPHRRLGYVPEISAFWPDLNAFEYLDFFLRTLCSELSAVQRKERIETVLKAVGLIERGKKSMGSFSKGMLQRASLARALVHDPEFLILDEPMSGLDPRAQEKLRQIIIHLKERGKTLVICTHALDDVERLCEYSVVLERGQLLHQGLSGSVLKDIRERYQREEPWDEEPLGDVSRV